MSAQAEQLQHSEQAAAKADAPNTGLAAPPKPPSRRPSLKLQRLKTLAETGAPWSELEILELTATLPRTGLSPEEKLRIQIQRVIALRLMGRLDEGWRLGRRAEAQAHGLTDDHAVILLELFRLALMTRQVRLAREYLAKAVMIIPGVSPELRSLLPLALGWLYLQLGAIEQALHFTNPVDAFVPTNHRYRLLINPTLQYGNLIWMYAVQGQFREALPYCEIGLKLIEGRQDAEGGVARQLLLNRAFVLTGLHRPLTAQDLTLNQQLHTTLPMPRQARVWRLLQTLQQILQHPQQATATHGPQALGLLGEMWTANDPIRQIEAYSLMLADQSWQAGDWQTERQAREHVQRAVRVTRQQSGALMGELIEISSQRQLSAQRTTQLYERLKKRSRALEFSTVDFATRMASIAEAREQSTGTHNYRVAALTGALAQALGCTQKYIRDLMLAAQLHDLGKISIPDAILLKAGPLSSEEWAVMQTHTTRGAELLRAGQSRVIRLAHDIAACHHERWDGGGYPARLSGTAIPLAARMVAVADVLDALTHARPYKAAWTFEEAVTEIQRNAGLQFDPEIVAAFNTLVLNGELRGILARYA
jgi:response regulator RpfG family c-di-GMP phosphodiesterase